MMAFMTTSDSSDEDFVPVIEGDSEASNPTPSSVFSMKEAAAVAGVSVSTLRRRREDLIAGGADVSDQGWRVPMTALIAAGLIKREGPNLGKPSKLTTKTSSTEASDPEPAQEQRIQELTEQVHQLEKDLAEWRRRAEVAEAVSQERLYALEVLKMANESERLALRMLTSGTSAGEQPRGHAAGQTAPTSSSVQSEPGRQETQEQPPAGPIRREEPRGWWARMTGR